MSDNENEMNKYAGLEDKLLTLKNIVKSKGIVDKKMREIISLSEKFPMLKEILKRINDKNDPKKSYDLLLKIFAEKNKNGISIFSLRYILKLYDTITIPEYQRNYEWHKEKGIINKFLDGLDEVKAKEYLGQIILFDNSSKSNPFDSINIVDGQQRITTLILYIITNMFLSLSDNEIEINSELNNLIFEFDISREDRDESVHGRINDFISSWKSYASETNKANKQEKKIEILIDDFFKSEYIKPFIQWIQKNSSKNKKLIKVILDKRFIAMNNNTEEDAFESFYKVNNISLKLSNWDNIRSFFYTKGFSKCDNFRAMIRVFDNLPTVLDRKFKDINKSKNEATVLLCMMLNKTIETTKSSFEKIESHLISSTDKEKTLSDIKNYISEYIRINNHEKIGNVEMEVLLRLMNYKRPSNLRNSIIVSMIEHEDEITYEQIEKFWKILFRFEIMTNREDYKNVEDLKKWTGNTYRAVLSNQLADSKLFDESNIDEFYTGISWEENEKSKKIIELNRDSIMDNLFAKNSFDGNNERLSLSINLLIDKSTWPENDLTDEHFFDKPSKNLLTVIDEEYRDSNWNRVLLKKKHNENVANGVNKKNPLEKVEFILSTNDEEYQSLRMFLGEVKKKYSKLEKDDEKFYIIESELIKRYIKGLDEFKSKIK